MQVLYWINNSAWNIQVWKKATWSLVTHLDPVSDPLVVGLVLQEFVQLFGELLSSEDLLTVFFLWLHLISHGELHFLNYVTKKNEDTLVCFQPFSLFWIQFLFFNLKTKRTKNKLKQKNHWQSPVTLSIYWSLQTWSVTNLLTSWSSGKKSLQFSPASVHMAPTFLGVWWKRKHTHSIKRV